MTKLTYSDSCTEPTIAILIREAHLDQNKIYQKYVNPLQQHGIPQEEIIAFGLEHNGSKVTAKMAKQCLDQLLGTIKAMPSVTQLIVCDATYFKTLTRESAIKKFYGENLKCKYDGYHTYQIVYAPSWVTLFYDPSNQNHITAGLDAIKNPYRNKIITKAEYGHTPVQARRIYHQLFPSQELTCDIETTGLPLGSALVSISFATDKNSGAAVYLRNSDSWEMLKDLKLFFQTYPGKLIFHRALFDVKHLIWILFMRHPQDYDGMKEGLRVFADVDDSQLITYLALNSTTDIDLGLKENSYEYTGNYGIDVTDAASVDPTELLEYNLKDALATWYVWEKYLPICQKDKQIDIYKNIFQPSIKPLLEMMLIGLPIDLYQVEKTKQKLQAIQQKHERYLFNHPQIKKLNLRLQKDEMRATNAKLKKKFRPVSEFRHVRFNPNSDPQIRKLIYDQLNYPIIAKTDTGLPSTKGKILDQLLGQGKHDDILTALIERAKTNIILGTFITAFEKYTIAGFLHGELNLGGTQSGRLSSSNPNLQNQPSGSTYGKLIKTCFIAPAGWLFWGIDFNALEERIGAILANDPNRIKVYTQGFDGHSLRAYKYFGNMMSNINSEDPVSINSIQHLFPEFRKNSKAPTFALQYGGTHFTLMRNCGFTKKQAIEIENAYHELYQASDAFAEKNMAFAQEHGYVECAFGLRLRTPLIHNSIRGSSHTPYAVIAEGRSSNNAITQSWGLLINRALIEAHATISQSSYCRDIFFSNTVHDALYGIVKARPETIAYLNDTLVTAMEWNDHPKIRSKEVPMMAKLEIGKSWDSLQEIANAASPHTINKIIKNL